MNIRIHVLCTHRHAHTSHTLKYDDHWWVTIKKKWIRTTKIKTNGERMVKATHARNNTFIAKFFIKHKHNWEKITEYVKVLACVRCVHSININYAYKLCLYVSYEYIVVNYLGIIVIFLFHRHFVFGLECFLPVGHALLLGHFHNICRKKFERIFRIL